MFSNGVLDAVSFILNKESVLAAVNVKLNNVKWCTRFCFKVIS